MTKDKLTGLIRLKLNGIFEPFNLHGLDVHIPAAQNAIMDLMEKYHQEMNKIERSEHGNR